MIEAGIRLLKRIAVFLPGLAVVYLTAGDVFTFFDRRLPLLPALLVTYIAIAYFIIPAVIRLIRFIMPPRHVPYYSTTPDGFASDPINVALFGPKEAVSKAMLAIGWYQADGKTPQTVFRLITSVLFKRPYPNAPFSSLYLLGRSQDLGFQLPVGTNPGHRHHVRFWAVKTDVAENFKEHIAFWQRHHQDKNHWDDTYLWLGAASRDIGIGIIRHNAQLTHMIHQDTNAERELIVKSLKKAGMVKKSRTVQIQTPYSLRNRVVTGFLQADGKLTICEL